MSNLHLEDGIVKRGHRVNWDLIPAEGSPLLAVADGFGGGGRYSDARRDTCAALLANLQHVAEHGRTLAVHRKLSISGGIVPIACDYIVAEGWAVQTLGRRGEHCTLLAAGPRMVELLAGRPPLALRQSNPPPPPIKVNKNNPLKPDGPPIPFKRLPSHPGLSSMQSQVESIRAFLRGVVVDYAPPGGTPAPINAASLQRVFTVNGAAFNSDAGGRLYCHYQNLPSGRPRPPGLPILQAAGLLPANPFEGQLFNAAASLVADIEQHHPGFDFHTPGGLKLQFLDSLIALHVIEDLQTQGIAALGVHDSFVVQDRHEQALAAAMAKAYTKVMHSPAPMVGRSNHPARKYIRIDNCATIELDYTALHPTMAYSLQGLEPPPLLYVHAKGHPLRAAYKTTLLRGLNCSRRRQWINSVKEWIEKG